jgi:tubulin polyglutamylase TTLL5
MPTTFNLPREYISFVEQYNADAYALVDPTSNLWIVKPVSLSRGRGIRVINEISSLAPGDPVVVQRYISNPYLIDGFKWDMRLYVLVTSFNPLEAFIYKEGFARFATHGYSTSATDITNEFIHLTNSSIQGKHNDGAGPPPDVIKRGCANNSPVDGGTKCSLQHLALLLCDGGVDFSALWERIVVVALRGLFAVQDSIPHQANSFELLGFDVIIDDHQKPWLLEANSSPSLSISTPLDKIIKETLVHDTIALVNPPAFDRLALHRALHNRVNGEPSFTCQHVFPEFTSAPRSTSSQPCLVLPADKCASSSAEQSMHAERFDKNTAWNDDLSSILGGKLPRQYGELPQKLGNFSRIAPGRSYDALLRLKNPFSSA